ncbi:MAG: putative glycosyltransferase EpsE [Bacteroidetes bacterium ADurb.Bin408]|nr:MAG: putative glycosyltransferase EpsE [Bacteroidetes bacterium ADurb.Bin408]
MTTLLSNTSTTDRPVISVLLPFYNPGKSLRRALESIICQTFTKWELILIDNGSTDETLAMAQEFAASDSRITLCHEPRKGIVNALNHGLSMCRGIYIARMDADDVSHPDRLWLQMDFLRDNPGVSLVSGLVRYASESSALEGYRRYVEWLNGIISENDICRNMFIESPFAHPSVMFTRAALEKYGTYAEGPFPEDYEMWLRWLCAGARCCKLPVTVLDWFDHPQRLSRTDPRYSPDAFNRVKIRYLDIWLRSHNPFHPCIAVWGAGKLGRKNAALLEELGHKVQFFIDVDTRKINAGKCISYKDVPPAGTCFIIGFVGNRHVTPQIRAFLNERGYTETVDYMLAAGIS